MRVCVCVCCSWRRVATSQLGAVAAAAGRKESIIHDANKHAVDACWSRGMGVDATGRVEILKKVACCFHHPGAFPNPSMLLPRQLARSHVRREVYSRPHLDFFSCPSQSRQVPRLSPRCSAVPSVCRLEILGHRRKAGLSKGAGLKRTFSDMGLQRSSRAAASQAQPRSIFLDKYRILDLFYALSGNLRDESPRAVFNERRFTRFLAHLLKSMPE